MATTVNTAGKDRALYALGASCTYAAALDATAELSGGSYARVKLTFRAWPQAGSGTDRVLNLNATTEHKFTVPAGKRVTRVAYVASSTITSGTLCIDDVTAESYTSEGYYSLSSGGITFGDPA